MMKNDWSSIFGSLAAFTVLLGGICLFYVFIHSTNDDVERLTHIKNIFLWTRERQVVAEELATNLESLRLSRSHFSPFRKTYIITHGFLSSAIYNWVITLKDALLMREDCNVLAVSWESGSSHLSYYLVQSRVPQVGLELAKVVENLKYEGALNLDSLHLIGHSLGAHVSGFAGKYFNGSVARITGLDPAGVGFNGIDPTERLSSSDAGFVDVVHTHGCTTLIQTYTCFGISSSIGDADFWLNGGDQQPACDSGGDGHRVVEYGSPCSHSMSYVYYTESIGYFPTSKHFLTRQCSSFEHYSNGSCECSFSPQYMGYNVNPRIKGNFFVNTSANWPYALEDHECSAGAYTWLEAIGMALLCSSISITLSLVLSLLWLQYNPEDKKLFSQEHIYAVVLMLSESLLQYQKNFFDSSQVRGIVQFFADEKESNDDGSSTRQ